VTVLPPEFLSGILVLEAKKKHSPYLFLGLKDSRQFLWPPLEIGQPPQVYLRTFFLFFNRSRNLTDSLVRGYIHPPSCLIFSLPEKLPIIRTRPFFRRPYQTQASYRFFSPFFLEIAPSLYMGVAPGPPLCEDTTFIFVCLPFSPRVFPPTFF